MDPFYDVPQTFADALAQIYGGVTELSLQGALSWDPEDHRNVGPWVFDDSSSGSQGNGEDIVVTGPSYPGGTQGGWIGGDDIIVRGERMSPEQMAAYDHHRLVAERFIDGLLLYTIGRVGYAGHSGWAGAAGAVGTTLLAEWRDQMIENAATLNYRRDGADGVYDGNVDPGYITGDLQLPPEP